MALSETQQPARRLIADGKTLTVCHEITAIRKVKVITTRHGMSTTVAENRK